MQAGAKKVYAVEASSMAIHTEKLVSSSPYAGRIKVIASKIEEVDLPEKVDMIISEPMGYMLYNERMLETYIHARKVKKRKIYKLKYDHIRFILYLFGTNIPISWNGSSWSLCVKLHF